MVANEWIDPKLMIAGRLSLQFKKIDNGSSTVCCPPNMNHIEDPDEPDSRQILFVAGSI